MIYFDRIEVVNYLDPAAGNPPEPKHLFLLSVQFLSHLESLQHEHMHRPLLSCSTFT